MVDRYPTDHKGWSVRHYYSWYRGGGGTGSYNWIGNKLQEHGAVNRERGRLGRAESGARLNPARAAATAGASLCLWFMYILIWRSVTCGPGMDGPLWSENPRLSNTPRGRGAVRPPRAGQPTIRQPIQPHLRQLT